jgi:rare lipoprotein A
MRKVCIIAAAITLAAFPTAAKEVVASYYHHGHTTASGERFKPDGLTAAHRTLPFGTKVRVTNISNHKSVVVTINDRGPFNKHREIDLSRGAARAIGILNRGVARVDMEVL